MTTIEDKRKIKYDDSLSKISLKHMLKVENLGIQKGEEEKKLQNNKIEEQKRKHQVLVREFSEFKNWVYKEH